MKIALFGAEGRMGKSVALLAKKRGHTVIPLEKRDNWQNFDVQADVAIDFSVPSATKDVCDFCLAHRCPLVTGVTGRNETEQRQLDELQKQLPVVAQCNFSQGANMLKKLAEKAAEMGWDCEIVEIHRKSKTDSPSGTAEWLAAAAAKNKNFGKVTIHSLRCGSNFGRHSVVFATQGESLTLTHQAENSEIFALGALKRAESLQRFAQNVSATKGQGAIDGQ